MVYNLLTVSDKTKILNYRNEYVFSTHNNYCGIEELVEYWNEAKSEYLEQVFGDELIVTKPIEFKESLYEIGDRIDKIVYGDARCSKFRHQLYMKYDQMASGTDWGSPERQATNFVYALFNLNTLAENKVPDYFFDDDNKVFELIMANGEILKVSKGMKPMKVLSKVTKSFNIGVEVGEGGISDFEHFRIQHSLALNQKVLRGDLCLSIHPLDYMTMSDNRECWSSCMSWADYGEYRLGTVEMMNSPCVVVAYLASKDHEYKWGSGEDFVWTSKKWRSLFIVDKDFIMNIKSYPYHNDNLTKAAIAELAKMSGWGEVEIAPYDYRWDKRDQVIGGKKFFIQCSTGAMYNDFGSNHFVAVNPNTEKEELIYTNYYYSGKTQCMVCGEQMHGDEADTLTCDSCDPREYCACCEERIYNDSYTYETADGDILCEYCWCENTVTDAITEERHLDTMVNTIYLSKTAEVLDEYGYVPPIYLSDHTINSSQWKEYFKIDKPRECSSYMTIYKYVTIEDCTEEGLNLFDLSASEETSTISVISDVTVSWEPPF